MSGNVAVTETSTGITINATKKITFVKPKQEISLSFSKITEFKPGFPLNGKVCSFLMKNVCGFFASISSFAI